MPSVTPSSHPLAAFDGLVNLERSRAFHAGRRAVGLATMEELVAALGPILSLPGLSRPEPAVHVAGSEGKTSVTERIAAGLSAMGRRVGTYTSPHLRDPSERLRIGGQLPDHPQLRLAVDAVCAAAESAGLEPSWFEAVTATALVLFTQQGVQAAVWETGLGGRLDATRVLPADLCVLTTISLEHTAVLGNTLSAVAREKAGILRPGVPLVCGRWLPDEARDVVLEETERLGCPLHLVDADPPDENPGNENPVDARNRALATTALEVLAAAGALDAADLPAGCAAARAHRVEGRDDLRDGVLYDGAHTVAAARGLAQLLGRAAPGPVILGVTSGRDAVAMAAALLPVAAPLLLTRAPGERGLDPEEVASALREQGQLPEETEHAILVEPDPRRALERARRLVRDRQGGALATDSTSPETAREMPRITVTGSLHLVGLLLPDPPGPSSPDPAPPED